jgi:hypothetical protein
MGTFIGSSRLADARQFLFPQFRSQLTNGVNGGPDGLLRLFFAQQKTRIQQYGLRYVEEADPAREALLEIYASIVLRKKVNDFDTH